jgi:hypothetical protein
MADGIGSSHQVPSFCTWLELDHWAKSATDVQLQVAAKIQILEAATLKRLEAVYRSFADSKLDKITPFL